MTIAETLKSAKTTMFVATLVTLVGCASTTPVLEENTSSGRDSKKLLVVDCLLPGQVRRLGQALTYITPRRPIKTSALQCEIRGGEYVSYDRANFATSLKIWLPKAEKGDPEAQTYVGEIFEKGLGLTPDPVLAAQWYRKAADQNFSRAQINLGYLYESGLGVERDLTKAMNFYRSAAGFEDGQLQYVTSIEVAARKIQTEQLQTLTEQNVILKDANSRLKAKQLAYNAQQTKFESLKETVKAQRILVAQNTPDDLSNTPASSGSKQLKQVLGELERLTGNLADSEIAKTASIRDLNEQQVQTNSLRKKFAQSNEELNKARNELSDQQTRISELEQSITDGSKQADAESIQKLEMQLSSANIAYDNQTQELESVKSKLTGKSRQLDVQLSNAEQRESELKNELSRLTNEVVSVAVDKAELKVDLTRELVEKQNNIVSLRKQIMQSNEDLLISRDSVSAQQLRITELQQELTDSQTSVVNASGNVNDDKSVELQEKLTDARASYEALNADIISLQKQQSSRSRSLESQLDTAEQRESALKSRLDESVVQIESLELQFEQRENSYREQLASLKTELERSNVNRMESDLAALELINLESQLAQQTTVISDQQAQINDLERRVTEVGATTKGPEYGQVADYVNAGPSIEILDPLVSVMRGGPALSSNSSRGKIKIIGRISPSENLLTFKVNGTQTAINKNGIFQYQVDSKTNSTMNFLAIDDAGERTNLELALYGKTVSKVDSGISSPQLDLSKVDFGNYHALIIGNNEFDYLQDLRTAVNDATSIERVLRTRFGFKTELLLNADRYSLLSALNRKKAELTSKDNLLIYYAGHGELSNSKGYWMPTDAEPDNTSNWIPNVEITDIVESMNAKHIMIVADSCYSGTLSRSSLPRLPQDLTSDQKLLWYNSITKSRVRTVLTSGGVKPVLDSAAVNSKHSMFSEAFLRELERSDNSVIEAYDLFLKVQEQVKNGAKTLGIEQTPQYSPMRHAGHESGEFLFIGKATL